MPKSTPAGSPWWERELASLREDLLRHVRRWFPALLDEHADLVQEALLGLTRELRERPDAYPTSWQSTALPDKADQGHLRALAITILRRRIADRFAARAREWSSRVLHSDDQGLVEPSIERRQLVRQLYAILLEALQTETAEDRSLLIRAELEPGTRPALTAAERQRLHRLRRRLDSAVRARLGASAGELLSGHGAD